jgi:L-cysteate sulfo-lyase
MTILELPRIQLAHLPTPVEELPLLGRQLGVQLFIKRDDQTGLADALNLDARTLITGGAPQSNHCRQTAAAAARTGLRCVLVLAGEESEKHVPTGNMLLDRMLGAQIVWTGGRGRDAVMDEVFEAEACAGNRPYLIPYGGSNAIGAAAYVAAMQEFAEQGIDVEWIVFATSSGGTQAGLALGARLVGFAGRLCGISVDKQASPYREQVAQLANRTAEKIGVSITVADSEISVDDRFTGAGYGIPGTLEMEAIALFARKEGILLDPVYTGRAAGGMLALIRAGEIPQGARILFWHTGGAPALWAYADQFILT